MEGQRRNDTVPELKLRKALFAAGLRYRVNYPLPGNRRRTIDVAFPRQRLAVFVDGCFWHVCPEHGVQPKNAAEWWREKLERNVARDRETDALLAREGWSVLRVWEHQDPNSSAKQVMNLLRSMRDHRNSS